jgi:hypothetical protein
MIFKSNNGFSLKVYPNGEKYYCLHGKLHREDGPAIIYPNGRKSYYLHDKRYDEKTYWVTVNDLQK